MESLASYAFVQNNLFPILKEKWKLKEEQKMLNERNKREKRAKQGNG